LSKYPYEPSEVKVISFVFIVGHNKSVFRNGEGGAKHEEWPTINICRMR